jgi:uncharacterized protein (DUF433 family)
VAVAVGPGIIREEKRRHRMPDVLDRLIEATPGVLGGKPRIAGHRISVALVAVMYTKLGLTAEAIAKRYNLSLAEVHAALAYYYENREEIDQRLREDETFIAEFKRKHLPLSLKRARAIKHG